MAGRRGSSQVAPSSALVASAVTLSGPGKIESVYRPMESWQKDAWDYYDITPELRFAATWVSNAASRCTLRPAKIGADNQLQATADPKIAAALSSIFGNSEGQSQMLYYIALNLTVAGECYLVGRDVPSTQAKGANGRGAKVWEVVSVREIRQSAGGWAINSSVDNQTITLKDTDSVVRVWRGHPAYRYQADSPVRALLPVLSEIKFLTLHIYAQTISRLAGAGIQVLPKSVEIPGVANDDKKAENILKILGKVMAKAIENPGDPSALIPIFLLVADDAVDKVKEPLHFWSPFDEKAVDSRKAAVVRFGVGFDLPPEVISGMSANLSSSGGRSTGLSHWGQWQIEESAIKMHIEPLLDVIINSLVLNLIRPLTDDPTAALIGDTNALKLQPDRSKEAADAFAAGALSDAGLRFYNGLSEDYAPKESDIAMRVLWKMASGSASPEMVLAAAEKLGVDLGLTPADVAGQQPAPESPPSPTPNQPESRGKPDIASALMMAADALVRRALERAGGRLRNAGVKPDGVPQHEVYLFTTVNGRAAELLDGAWTHVPEVCDGVCDPDKLTRALQSYCESLMMEKAPHSRESLARYLTLVDA